MAWSSAVSHRWDVLSWLALAFPSAIRGLHPAFPAAFRPVGGQAYWRAAPLSSLGEKSLRRGVLRLRHMLNLRSRPMTYLLEAVSTRRRPHEPLARYHGRPARIGWSGLRHGLDRQRNSGAWRHRCRLASRHLGQARELACGPSMRPFARLAPGADQS